MAGSISLKPELYLAAFGLLNSHFCIDDEPVGYICIRVIFAQKDSGIRTPNVLNGTTLAHQ